MVLKRVKSPVRCGSFTCLCLLIHPHLYIDLLCSGLLVGVTTEEKQWKVSIPVALDTKKLQVYALIFEIHFLKTHHVISEYRYGGNSSYQDLIP